MILTRKVYLWMLYVKLHQKVEICRSINTLSIFLSSTCPYHDSSITYSLYYASYFINYAYYTLDITLNCQVSLRSPVHYHSMVHTGIQYATTTQPSNVSCSRVFLSLSSVSLKAEGLLKIINLTYLLYASFI